MRHFGPAAAATAFYNCPFAPSTFYSFIIATERRFYEIIQIQNIGGNCVLNISGVSSKLQLF